MTKKSWQAYWYSYTEALLTSLVIGLAENYFVAVALHKGVSAIQSGLIVSLPLVFAGLAHWLFQKRIKKKQIAQYVIQSVFFQCVSLMALSLVSFLYLSPDVTFILMMICLSIYWYGHYSVQPAWNKWIGDIVPFQDGKSFFSFRIRITQIGIIIGLIFGGVLLKNQNNSQILDLLFFVLFFICALLKFFVIKLFQHHPYDLNQTIHPLFSTFADCKKQFLEFNPFFIRIGFFNLALFLSAPFVAGYLLKIKNLSYYDFMIVMAGLFIGKIATTIILNFDRTELNAHKLFFMGGVIAAPLPALWPFFHEVWQLFAIHFISGLGWAAWEVGLSLSYFRHLSDHKKQQVVSLYNYLGISAQVIGTLVGAFLFTTVFSSDFDMLFIFSGAVRLFCVLFLKNTRIGTP